VNHPARTIETKDEVGSKSQNSLCLFNMKYPVKYARPLIYWEAIGLLYGLLYFTNRIPKMLKRAPNIEIAILDSRQHKIEIQYSQFSNDVFTERTVKLTFKKFEKELIELILL
jgi:hypothetical protein